ncbi:MAG TPA: M48 family metallopeptidase [Zeimonas sp.]|nr:M48 family metallopeptidase [Zeimonas sp.]
MNPKRLIAAAAMAAALVLTACTTVQTTSPGAVGIDRTQRMSTLVSEAQMREEAMQAYRQIVQQQRQKGALNVDAALTGRVRAITARLIPASTAFRPEARSWSWEVNVFESPEVNAWVMPGGKIGVYSGLVKKLNLTDDEIAAVLGHEIAHALREHARERASEQIGAQVLITGAATVLGAGQAGTDLGNVFYKTFFGLPNSRLHETEADRIGVEIAARAGYDPRAAITLWQKMASQAGGGGGPEFLSTHPSPETRIRDLQVYAERVMPLYQQARR